ncbi:MAG: hypothetical protein H7Z76_14545 [Methylotenera sp.]|nr:hypothetical protein [Flavobacterium sp.]
MEEKTIYRPLQPNKPELFRLKTYYWTDLISVDSWIIFGFVFVYGMHLEGAFDSLEIYYLAIGLYILIRLWPFIVTNSKIRSENNKMIDSYDKEVLKFEKELKDFYVLKKRMDFERETSKKLEQIRKAEADLQFRWELHRQKSFEIERQNRIDPQQQIRMEAERQKRLELNRLNSLELIRQKKLDFERQNLMDLERKSHPDIKTPEEESKGVYQELLENWGKNSIENLRDSTSIYKKNNQIESEINDTIRNYSGICAVLAIQPIPFADIFILTPTQILLGKKIASLRGYEIKENTIESILKKISGIIGMGIIAQQLVIGAYKTFLPFLGGITTIPVVYGLTYGIGKTMDYYIVAKINGTQINKSDIEKIFKSSRQIGEREGKSKEKEIQAKAKK